VLRELDIETWLLVGGAPTVRPAGKSLMLTHEGLNRMARHVVRTYIQRGSTELDRDYQWRDLHCRSLALSSFPHVWTPRLWILVAERLWLDGGHDLACASVGRAVECSPGHEHLLALEPANATRASTGSP
jgi:hypothetical protein